MIFKKILKENKILTEAPTTDVDYDALEAEIEAGSSGVFSDEVNALIDNGEWSNAYRKLNGIIEKGKLIDRFIEVWSTGLDRIYSNFKSKIDTIKVPLNDTMVSLGANAFDDTTNPILIYLETFLGKLGKTMTADGYIELNNLFADNIIKTKHLRMSGPDKCIIFNEHLWSKGDVQFIVKSYFWLNNETNVKRYLDYEKEDSVRNWIRMTFNVEGMRDDAGRFLSGIKVFKNITDFRNFIIYENKDDVEGEIHQPEIISRLLKGLEAASGFKTEDTEEDDYDRMKKSPYTEEEIDKITKGGLVGLDKAKAGKLMSYFRTKGWIK